MSLICLWFRMYVKVISERRLSDSRCFPDQEIFSRHLADVCVLYGYRSRDLDLFKESVYPNQPVHLKDPNCLFMNQIWFISSKCPKWPHDLPLRPCPKSHMKPLRSSSLVWNSGSPYFHGVMLLWLLGRRCGAHLQKCAKGVLTNTLQKAKMTNGTPYILVDLKVTWTRKPL